MAPFGKSFLKARLKNYRTKDAEPAVGKEIQITVCDEEKVVCGVTKHTTCADLVQALLEDHRSAADSKRLLQGGREDFCLVERWKGLERALPPLTRILRLWSAWGDQKPLIQFVLVKISDFVPQPAAKGKPKGAGPKGARPKRYERGGARQPLPEERQKRMVKKAFRKLEKLHRTPRSPPGAEEVDRMVRLILAQDHTLREQGQRLRDLDLDIRRSELCAQSGAGAETGVGPPAQSPDPRDDEELQRYLRCTGDGVEQLELQVRRHQELIRQLSRDIDLELATAGPVGPQSRAEGPQPEQEGATAGPCISTREAETESAFYAAELEAVRSELQRSMWAGVALHYQLSEMDCELQLYQSAMASKDQECWQLASQLSSMQLGCAGEDTGSPGAGPGPRPGTGQGAAKSSGRCSVSQATVRLKHSVSPTDVTDTDSDTGISSTHSQDSLSPCLDSLSPCLDSLSPCQDSLSPCKGSLSPCQDSLSPCQDSLSLCKGSLSPCQDSLSLCKGSLSPCQDSLSPCQDSLSPCKGSLSPCQGSLSPCQDSLSPCQSSLSPRLEFPPPVDTDV